MKKLLAVLLLLPSFAFAQQQQQGDPALSACQQLLGQANAQTIQVAAQAQTLGKQLEAANAEIERLKNPEKK